MPAAFFQNEGEGVDRLGVNRNPPANATGDRRAALVDVEHKRAALPACRRPSDRERVAASRHGGSPAFRHRPSRGSRAVERHIEGAVIERIAPSRPGIVGREDAPDEGDDGQSMLAIVADRVDVPPGIAAGYDLLVEARSSITRMAA